MLALPRREEKLESLNIQGREPSLTSPFFLSLSSVLGVQSFHSVCVRIPQMLLVDVYGFTLSHNFIFDWLHIFVLHCWIMSQYHFDHRILYIFSLDI